jgi:DNA-binding HxlR family transcriptional regulator
MPNDPFGFVVREIVANRFWTVQTHKFLTESIEMPYRRKRSAPDPCPVEIVVAMISGKWKARVLYLLAQGDLTFGEIRTSVGSVSQQVLSNLLKELEIDKVVERTRTHLALASGYQLTPKGRQLFGLLLPLSEWGNELLSEQGVTWEPPLAIRKKSLASSAAARTP